MVRDFLYYDQNRITSYGSQLLEGLANSIIDTKEKSNDLDKTIDLSGKIDLSAKLGKDSFDLLSFLINKIGNIETSLGGNVQYQRQKYDHLSQNITENKILSHFQFSLLRNALVEKGLLKNLDRIPENRWHNRSVLKEIVPGDFIELSCYVKLFDKGHLEKITKSVEKLMELMQQIDYSKIIEEKSKNGEDVSEFIKQVDDDPMNIGYEIYKKVLGGKIEPVLFTAMVEFIKNLSDGDIGQVPMQVIAKPINGSKKSLSFISPIKEEFLVETRDEILFKYGYKPNQQWKILAQVCEIPNKETIDVDNLSNLNISNSHSFDEITESITDFFMDMSKSIGLHSYIKFPNVSINLIALYREKNEKTEN